MVGLTIEAISTGSRARLIGLILAAAVAAACPSSSTGPPDASPDAGAICPDPAADGGIAVDDYCPTFAEVLCTGYRQCCDIGDIEACRARVAAECEAGEISSIRAGQSCLDGPVARRCLDAWAAAFEDCLYDDDIGGACRFQWYGNAVAGESCRDVWHCERGLGCLLDGTSGTCIELPGEDESCAESTACRPGGLYCSYIDWTCHREPGLGDECERDGICAAGACEDGRCQEVPWC